MRAGGIWFALGAQGLGKHWAYQFRVCVIFVCFGNTTRTQFLVEYGL